MAAKRVIEQDPEYEPVLMEIEEKRMKFIERDARNATVKKIESILISQFGPEINGKATEVEAIDDMLHEARQTLDKLRACAVRKYFYDVGNKDAKPSENFDSSIHPTEKENLVGKAPKFSLNTVKIEPTDSSNSLVEDQIQNVSVSTNDNNSDVRNMKTTAIDDDEMPSRTPRMKTKCKVIVGNVSKFLPAASRDEDDQSTHKWMVYVRGDKDCPSLDAIVKKVFFLLHSSYRPNDVVEVCTPPFHLVKRGWGEFIIRVQLHFKDPRNKPVDIFHHLKLDKTYTGLQTLGAETVAELTLYKPDDKVSSCKPTSDQLPSVPSLIHQPPVPPLIVPDKTTAATIVPNVTSAHNDTSDNNVIVANVTVAVAESLKEKEPSAPTNATPVALPIKSFLSPVKNAQRPKPVTPLSRQPNILPLKAAPLTIADKEKCPIIISKQSPQAKPLRTISQATKNQLTNGVGTFIKCTDSQGRILLVPQTSLICMSSVNNNTVVKPFTVTQTVMQPQSSSTGEVGKAVIRNVAPSNMQSSAKLPSYVLKVIPTVQSRPNQVLLIPVSEGSQKIQTTPTVSVANITTPPTVSQIQQHNSVKPVVPPSPVKKIKTLLHWEQVIGKVRIEQHSSFLELLRQLMKVFPLISQEYDPASIPFCAPSVEVFQSWNIGKQRAAEWQRAGMVRFAAMKLLNTPNSSVKPVEVWSRRDIMVWCRKNGYTPPLHEKSSAAPADARPVPAASEICTISDVKSIMTSLEESQITVPEVEEEEEEEDGEVDIISVDNKKQCTKESITSLSHKETIPPSSPSVFFVRETAAEIGVKLKPVEVAPSILSPVIEEMILAACKVFASDLIRTSLMQGYNRVGGKMCPEEVTVQDVFGAVQSNNSFDFLTNKHLGVLNEPLDQS